MRVAIYDKVPGAGLWQAFLALTWRVGCFLHKLFGKLDAYYAATSWENAFNWLATQPGTLESIQYWGHGSSGTAWLAQQRFNIAHVEYVKTKVTPSSVFWFRTCSTFQGAKGYAFSELLTGELNCVVAGHTRIIGLFQGGLHTRKPGEEPRWSIDESEFVHSRLAKLGLRSGGNTVFCLTSKIPEGW